MLKILIYFIVFIVVFVLLVRYLEQTSVFYPAKEIAATPQAVALDYQDVFFKTSDHLKLNGWFVKREGAVATLIFLHGNAGNIGDRLSTIRYYHDLGVNVFIIDYRGYGQSEGRPTEAGIYKDAQAAYDYLLSRPDIDREKIIIYGASLGGVVAVDLASRNHVAALIADSTFSSAADMAKIIYPFVPSFLLMIKMDSESKIGKMKVPKIFIHSADDETVPIRLGKKLFDASPEPKRFVEVTGTHNDIRDEADQLKVTKALIEFLQPLELLP